jgi:hypothetical protein
MNRSPETTARNGAGFAATSASNNPTGIIRMGLCEPDRVRVRPSTVRLLPILSNRVLARPYLSATHGGGQVLEHRLQTRADVQAVALERRVCPTPRRAVPASTVPQGSTNSPERTTEVGKCEKATEWPIVGLWSKCLCVYQTSKTKPALGLLISLTHLNISVRFAATMG